MSNGTDNKFNMFDDIEEYKDEVQEELDVEIVSVTMKADTRKKYSAAVIARTVEEYETYITGSYYETLIHPVSKQPYEVKVTVLKDEVNPLELLKPAYAYSSNH